MSTAEIRLEPEAGQLICVPTTGEDKRSVAALIRRMCPTIRFKVDGGNLRLEIADAIELFEKSTSSSILWSDEASSYITKFAAGYSRRNSAIRRLTELESSDVNQLLLDYDRVSILDPHQRIAVAAMSDPLIDGLCLFDEQGSGKTVMTIHAFDKLASSGMEDKLLIFAPKNMLPTWKSDFEKFMGGKYKVQVVSGDKASKLSALFEPADVYVTNFETGDSMEDSLRALLVRNLGKVILVVDESFFVKNPAAVRSSSIRRLRNLCERCWMLCGTPAPNAAIDVVHQFDIADCGVTFSSVTLPKDKTAQRNTIQAVVENRGLYLRRLKRDILPNLPIKSFERVSVEMEPIQRGLYEETLYGLLADVVGADERGFRDLFGSFLARRMALLQIASNPKLVFPDYDRVPPKQAALARLLHELITVRGEKVVLWSYFRNTLNELDETFAGFGSVRLDGSITDLDARATAVQRFQEDPKTMLFIANPAAAGAGITLTTSRIAVYESFPTQAAHFLQSVDRIHRRGQTREAHYYFLLSTDSIDEIEYQRLLEKDRLGFQLFGDAPQELFTREYLLRELEDAVSRLNRVE